MSESSSDYVIKKYVKEGFVFRLLPMIIVLVLIVVGTGFSNGDGQFDTGMFTSQSIMMSILTYVYFKFHFRTITLNENEIVYKALTFKTRIKFSDIEDMQIMISEITKQKTFHLAIVTVISERAWKIANLQHYRKKDIELLIRKIMQHTSFPYDQSDLDEIMNEIEWVELGISVKK